MAPKENTVKAARLPALALTVLVTAITASLGATEPEAESPVTTRNVLFLIADDLRADVLGCYGNHVCETPNIDRLAARGVVFERAYCQGVVCKPSRTSFMFSRYTGRGEVNVGEHFKKNGWYSARAGKIYHMRVPGDIIAGTNGLDVASSWTERFNCPGPEAHTPGDYACLNQNIFTNALENRQSTRMPHRMFVSVEYDGDGSDQPDHKVATKIIELLRKSREERFFLAAGFVRPHYPMVAPRQYFARYDWRKIALPLRHENDLADIPAKGRPARTTETNGIGRYPDNEKRMWAAYYAAVTFMDDQVGRVLDELDRLGLRDSTTVVFTSDHGYHLGEHGFWQKANLHEKATHVPLIIASPGYTPARSRSLAELVDLFPTISELAGLPVPTGLHGKSLRPVLRDAATEVRRGALSISGGFGWRTTDWAYMRYPSGAEELYDMRSDPGQYHNLASDEQAAATRRRLSRELDEKLRASGIRKR